MSKLSFKTIYKKETEHIRPSNAIIFGFGIVLGILGIFAAFIDGRKFFGASRYFEPKGIGHIIGQMFEIIIGFGSGFAIAILILRVTPRSYFYLSIAAIFFFLSSKYYPDISDGDSTLSVAGIIFLCLVLSKCIESILSFLVLALPKGRNTLIKKLADWLDIE